MNGKVDGFSTLVRPYVTALFATAVVVGWLGFDKLSDDAFLGLVGLVLGFWFRDRSDSKAQPNGNGSA